MNNPYNLLQNIKPILPNECISHIFSFHRPKHIISENIKQNFLKCEVCNSVVKTHDGQISLRYYKIIHSRCIDCEPTSKAHIICKYCSLNDNCKCDDRSDSDSYYSWFSF